MSTQRFIHLLFVLIAGALAGCDWTLNHKDDPNHCPGLPHDNCLNDGAVSCQSAEDCGGPTPACIDNACRPCTAHSQCDSKVCLIDDGGTCAAPDQVAYVQEGGAGATCSISQPCGTLAAGARAGRPYIKFAAGVVKDTSATTIEGQELTILADHGATLDRDGDGPILVVRGATTNVSISDLRIAGATGMDEDAIRLEPGGGSPTLALRRVKVELNQGRGIVVTGGAITVTQSTISGNAGGGISVTGGAGTTFDLTNNFIVRNGEEDTSPFGGVNLNVTVAGAHRFEFNTVVDNRTRIGSTRSGGVICDLLEFMAPNNIVARNRIGRDTTAPNAQTLGTCTYPTSLVQDEVTTIHFVSPEMPPYSFQLLPGSAAIDRAATASSVALDHDGDPRPQGAQKDVGADELAP